MTVQGAPRVPDRSAPRPLPLAEQFYATHCLRTDSLQDQEGFGVRAASTQDAGLLEFVRNLPAHELPVDQWSERPQALQAPRRLALLRLVDGRAALVHSAYLPADSLRQGRNYFTHVLVYPELNLLQAVQTWASPDWCSEYPSGASRHLERFSGLPVPDSLDDQALADFLSPEGRPSTDQTLAVATYPRRWQHEPVHRREWLRRGLAGLLQVLEAPGQPRLFLLAEPGLVAMLVYAIARLLPARLIARLTFSTYESPQGSLWDADFARIVGTWNASGKPLDPDRVGRHGIAVQALPDGPSLDVAVPPIVDHLLGLNLMDRQDRTTLEDMHALWDRDPALRPATLGDILTARPALQSLLAGKAGVSELLVLAGTSLGRCLLADQEALAWPLVRAHAVREAAIRQAFLPWLQKRRGDLEAELAAAIGQGSPEEWLARWQVLAAVAPANTAGNVLVEVLDRARSGVTVQSGLYPQPWRLALVRVWHSVRPGDACLPARHGHLLVASTPEELDRLAGSGIPLGWIGQALWLALARPALVDTVEKRLRGGPPELLRAFAAAIPAEGVAVEDLLAALLPADEPASPGLFATLIGNGLKLEWQRLERLLDRVRADGPAWCSGVWRQGTHLLDVSRQLPATSAMLGRVWDACCKTLDQGLLHGDRQQGEQFRFLIGCRKKLAEATPAGAARTLDDWAMLAEHLQRPQAPGRPPAHDLNEACHRRGISARFALLRGVFAGTLASAEPLPRKSLQRIVAVVFGFYHPDEDRAFAVLLDLITTSPTGLQSDYQHHFLSAVSEASRPALVVKYRKRLLVSQEALNELLQVNPTVGTPRRLLLVAGGAFLLGGGIGFGLGWLLGRRSSP